MSFCKKFQSSTSSSAAKWQFKSDLRKKETDNGNAIVNSSTEDLLKWCNASQFAIPKNFLAAWSDMDKKDSDRLEKNFMYINYFFMSMDQFF
jgi:hypothetical protein